MCTPTLVTLLVKEEGIIIESNSFYIYLFFFFFFNTKNKNKK
jgi:hypothetical protein